MIVGIVLIILCLLAVMVYLLIAWYSKKVYAFFLGKRMEDDNTLHYFSCDDYKDINLTKREGNFDSDGNQLRYYIYENNNISKKEFIVFCHGWGAGHIQYMEEIAFFVKQGYQVFTYDVRGCLNSKGEAIESFSSALRDLHNALLFIETLKEFDDKTILLYGHSMGGFCVNNISLFNHKNIVGAVSVSSFNKVETLFHDMVVKLGGEKSVIIANFMTKEELKHNKELGVITSVESLKLVNYPMLMISGDEDRVVFHNANHKIYEEVFKDNPLFTFITVKGRYHRPNISLEATEYCAYVDKKIEEYNALKKNQKSLEKQKMLYDSFDYRKMVEFDYEVMNEIVKFYQKCSKI